MGRTGDEALPQRLLAVATRLFAEKGFEKTSVQEIVEAAGVTKGAMYHYFAGKDDLLQEIYERLLRTQRERLEATMAEAQPVARRLHGAAGLSEDFSLAGAYARLRTVRFADGPEEVHKNALARHELRWQASARQDIRA
ncbi:TetR/AcrR family transcriptional regulator [Micromonospora inositola]|uniref:Transcriptional regulator, TetR family n=1 Tax=Micromonospora inositola TaxID=47865 RepID=A0A1C5JT58_9ACTN|nr:helix-turn-helix domain-containing protein [Micromonospora inositola]SCG73439.1 transcriptional regulator, TetR family [Micromonospora inositola]